MFEPVKWKGFKVKAYNRVLAPAGVGYFPWKSIWKPKVPTKVRFFLWVGSLGKILTDNLRKRNIVLVRWCCVSKRGGETMDHLMLHCSVARETWDMVFALFGVPRVMLGKVVHLPPVGSASKGEEMQETLKDVGEKFYL